MKVIDGELLLGVFKEPVKDSSRQEESLIVTFEIGKHLNHPVDHSGPHLAINFILYAHICELFETIFGVELGQAFVGEALNHVSNDVWGQHSSFLILMFYLSISVVWVLGRWREGSDGHRYFDCHQRRKDHYHPFRRWLNFWPISHVFNLGSDMFRSYVQSLCRQVCHHQSVKVKRFSDFNSNYWLSYLTQRRDSWVRSIKSALRTIKEDCI